VGSGKFQRDVRTRVGSTYDENISRPQLHRPPVLAGMQLHDSRIQFGGEIWQPRRLEAARCHNDVAGLIVAVAGRDHEPA
jgi:hypothetical protein